ncbi:MAG: DUF4062 domain-containing protein [Candidatus Brocadiia bacterium]
MNKRYQVFVSSTYEDLQEERKEVMQALLELECIPSGMELFPAANDDQWTLIKRVIDDCDYYLVIIAGRYGSVDLTGTSYTEREYRYALQQGKPIVAFLHKDPGELVSKRCEESEGGKKRLKEFRALAEKKMVKYWKDPMELGSMVGRSINLLMRNCPAVGWVRADLLPDQDATSEILRLRNRIAELEDVLQSSRSYAPAGTEGLAQGDDQVLLEYHAGTTWSTDSPIETSASTWNQVFAAVAPKMIDETSECDLRKAIEYYVTDQKRAAKRRGGYERFECRLSDKCLGTVVVQLRALGLIAKSDKKRSLKDSQTYWTLTPYGDSVMNKLRALRRKPSAGSG